MSKTCENCRFWSERLAQSIGMAPVEAYCFGKGGPFYGRYTVVNRTCKQWASNYNGAVDDPVNEGLDPYLGETEADRLTEP